MTQKHFIAIASVIKSQIIAADGLSNEACRETARIAAVGIANGFARIAASDNPKFDTQRFLRACGIGCSACGGGRAHTPANCSVAFRG